MARQIRFKPGGYFLRPIGLTTVSLHLPCLYYTTKSAGDKPQTRNRRYSYFITTKTSVPNVAHHSRLIVTPNAALQKASNASRIPQAEQIFVLLSDRLMAG